MCAAFSFSQTLTIILFQQKIITFPTSAALLHEMKQSLWEISAQVSEHAVVALVMTDELLILPDTEVAAVSRNIQDLFFSPFLAFVSAVLLGSAPPFGKLV